VGVGEQLEGRGYKRKKSWGKDSSKHHNTKSLGLVAKPASKKIISKQQDAVVGKQQKGRGGRENGHSVGKEKNHF